jgi:hypothetical protein
VTLCSKSYLENITSEVIIKFHAAVFWIITPCGLVAEYQLQKASHLTTVCHNRSPQHVKTLKFVWMAFKLTKCPKPVVDCYHHNFIERCHNMTGKQVGRTSHEITPMNVEHYWVLLGKSWLNLWVEGKNIQNLTLLWLHSARSFPFPCPAVWTHSTFCFAVDCMWVMHITLYPTSVGI